MTGNLIKNIIRGTVYPNSYIMYNNTARRVIRTAEKTVVIDDDGNDRRISKAEAENNVIKYIVQMGTKIYDLSYTDYGLAIDAGSIVEGYTVVVKSRALIGATVKIDCLQTVDKYNLYKFDDRYGIILSKEGSMYKIDLTRSNKGTIVLHRTRFSLVNEKDSRIFFKLICPVCHR